MLELTFQSTHPSGVRPTSSPLLGRQPIFQSTHPSGVRLNFSVRAPGWAEFQSTHPSGVRRVTTSTTQSITNFNPRTPVGCDGLGNDIGHRRGISIHAPQWGATGRIVFPIGYVVIFQSTHPSGVRLSHTRVSKRWLHFNPRTPVGCDDGSRSYACQTSNFNPRTQWGATSTEPNRSASPVISIHAPQWGATGNRAPSI